VASSGLRARSRAAFLTGPTLAAFRIPGYPVLWLAGWAGGFGWAISLVAIGWVTLEVSNSAFAVGVAFAARLLPALLFGIPLGGLVDRFDRRTTLIVVNALSAASLFGVGLIAVAGHLGLTELLILSLGLGVIDTTRGTAYQSYVFDLAGPEGATNAIALGNMGGAFAGAVGSVTGGIVLEQVGVGATFWMAAAFAASAAAGLALTGRTARQASATPRLVPSFTRSLTLVLRNRKVALILLVVIVNEVLGFASTTLLPTFTRDVLNSDAAGLGALASARAVGGIAGLLLLARIGTRNRGGRMFLLATLTSGLALAGFAVSTWFAASLLLLVVVGVAWAVCDTLGQSLIQRSVEDHERGAAMGVWFFGIGFGPFGHLALGAAATVIAAPIVLAVDGIALALIALGLFSVKTLRRLP
jgi:MFS family permease